MKPAYFICIVATLFFLSHKNTKAFIVPNGGEQIIVGQNFTIKWDNSFFPKQEEVNIYLWVQTSSKWVLIERVPSPTGAYNWKVPNTDGDYYRIKIQSVSNPSLVQMSETYFSIIIPKNREYNLSTTTEKVNVTPNPIDNIATFSWIENGIFMRIVNSSGNVLYKTSLPYSNSYTLDLKFLVQGLYFVEVVTENNKVIIGEFLVIR